MTDNTDLSKILFIDIETVPQYPDFQNLPEDWKELWSHKAKFLKHDPETENAETMYNRAGIYSEFGKIVCISTGFISQQSGVRRLKIKSFYGEDEKKLLTEFSTLLNAHFNTREHFLCAHNGKEFDYPYLCRRMLVNDLNIPSILDISGKKPWEVSLFDTMEMWKFGDYKSYTSLNLLAAVFGLPSPKDDIDGSLVWQVFWKDRDLERIKNYCQKDVVTLTQVFLKLRKETIVKPEDIILAS